MELHRLKPMKENIDVELFNSYYKKVKPYIKSLSYHIDNRRFGITKDVLESWFEDKFIYVFNKYFGEMNNDHLFGHILKSLDIFKHKILMRAHQAHRTELFSNTIDLENNQLFNIIRVEDEPDNKELLYKLALEFFKKNLSEEAYFIFELQLEPPLFIKSKMNNANSKIPAKLIVEYLGWELCQSNINYINCLRSHITDTTNKAREYFNSLALQC